MQFNVVTIGEFLLKEESDRMAIKHTNDPDLLILLNEDQYCGSVIHELLDTYADGNKGIELYGPGVSRLEEPGVTVVIGDEIQAYALSHQKIILFAAVEQALANTNNPSHLLAKAVVGHEIGHIVHKDNEKSPFVTTLAGGLTFYAAHKGLQVSTLRNRSSFLKSAFVVSAAMLAKNTADHLISSVYSRSIEREADFHLIEKTKDPLVLKALASYIRNIENKYEKESFMQKLLSTHPSLAERAEYLGKAANALERKKQ